MKKSLVFGSMIFLMVTMLLFNNCNQATNNSKETNVRTDTSSISGCPNPPIVSLSPQIPADVCIPDNFAENPIAFFDDYSWKTFIALMWPALPGQRGVANSNASITDKGPRVFETYKGLWEIFNNDGSNPATWNLYDASNACAVKPTFGQLILSSFSKFGDLGQASFGSLIGPLPCQNNTYTMYFTSFNKIEFDAIVANQWYLRKNLNQSITFQDGALDIKSSWIDMSNIAHPERYFTDSAIVMDPITGKCTKKLVGLVGLHIVQKTSSRPQWIWSTFEQVDNIPQQGAVAPFAFNDGKGAKMPSPNPDNLNPLTIPPVIFNVERGEPINTSTQKTNAAYQNVLKKKNSVWQFYQLVMTQWPLQLNPPNPIPANQAGTPAFTFPGNGTDKTAFSNITMETFEQVRIRTGCMSCHFGTSSTDFLWSLNDHAFPALVPNLMFTNQSLKNLNKLLKSNLDDVKPIEKKKNK